jgi:hypothetical protein
MRIGSKSLEKKNTKTVTFFRGEEEITLTVGPLPPKYVDRIIDKLFPVPTPPKKALEERPGKYVKENGKVVFQEDHNDPKYREDLDQFISFMTAAKLVAYLEHDPDVKFESQKPTAGYGEAQDAWRDYFRSVCAEATDETTGFTRSEISHIIEAGESTELCLGVDEAVKTF